jgi:GNAT superfamily N-acetyltransferase
MPGFLHLVQGEETDRAVVTVTFLRQNVRKITPPVFGPGVTLTAERPTVAQYRELYNNVGGPWLWWLRRIMPDDALRRHLAQKTVHIQVLRVDGEPAGFFETETSYWPDVNLNYFGLDPRFIGRGLGGKLLDAALASAFNGAFGVRAMTVNTCTADHPRALPNYKAAGFVEVRRVQEAWDIPTRLGFVIPEHIKG